MGQYDVLCGGPEIEKRPILPYSDIVCDFLDAYSSALRHDYQAKSYPDIRTFAFWIRKANIQSLKQQYIESFGREFRLGKGIIFHIAPSNVPVNFMYSYVFGLLAGNSNIVRVPTKGFPQIECMCRVLNLLLQQDLYSEITKRTLIVRYGHSKECTDYFSKMCNLRVIWGGDDTIQAIRQSQLPPRSTEITFADRYSFGIIALEELKNVSSKELEGLAEKFYNDTFLMDQNACSAPHLIMWKTAPHILQKETQKIKEQFWLSVEKTAEKYDFPDRKSSEKYCLLCEKAAEGPAVQKANKYHSNRLFVCDVDIAEEASVETLRGKFGLFYQCDIDNLDALWILNSEKVQTCAYYGVNPIEIREWIAEKGIVGIDRIVPFGSTLDIGVVWDGYNLIAQMSRCITAI